MVPTEERDPADRHPTATALLEATVSDLDTGSETALRVADILERTGVSVSSLYYHFGSREGMVIAAQVERFNRSVAAHVDTFVLDAASVTTTAELGQLLTRMLRRLDAPDSRDARATRVSVLGSSITRPDLLAAVASQQRIVVDTFATALDTLKERAVVPEALNTFGFATWLLGMTLGRLLTEIMGDPELDQAWTDVAIRAALAPLEAHDTLS